jgi:heat shock protein HslJ
MTYRSAWTTSGTATLVDGAYSEQAAPGSATRTRIMLTDKVAYGTLNGERTAAVILVTDPGGSGTFYDLAVVVVRDGRPINIALTNLGDRIKINTLSIQDNAVVVDMVTQSSLTSMASLTRQVVYTYVLQGSALIHVSSKNEESTAPLSGTSWRWEKFQGTTADTITVTQAGAYTIDFRPDGKVSIRADCNRGSGTYTIKGNDLAISIKVLTRAACPPESLSDRYIQHLNDVASYVFESGRLTLYLKTDEDRMVFTSRK